MLSFCEIVWFTRALKRSVADGNKV
jgi:hypothetical protein